MEEIDEHFLMFNRKIDETTSEETDSDSSRIIDIEFKK